MEFIGDIETSEQFWVAFNAHANEIRAFLTSEKMDEAKAKYTTVQELAAGAAQFLPQYDVRRSQEEVELLREALRAAETKTKPKKKFAFGARNKLNSSPIDTTPSATVSVVKPVEVSVDLLGSVSYQNKANDFADMTKDVIDAQNEHVQFYSNNVESCTVNIDNIVGSTRLENISNSVYYIGPCRTSVYLENCKNFTLFTACHQLRIHNCHHCKIFIHCNTNPIIEHCTNMHFGPLLAKYDSFDEHALTAGVSDTAGSSHYDTVVDFGWHRATPSPNWQVIPSEERDHSITCNTWKLITSTMSAIKTDVIITPATAADAEFLATAICRAERAHTGRGIWDCLFEHPTNENGVTACLQYVSELCPTSHLHYSLFSVVRNASGVAVAAGCGFTYPERSISGSRPAMMEATAHVHGWSEAQFDEAWTKIDFLDTMFPEDVPYSGSFFIESFYVSEVCRGQGIGALLLRHLIECAHQQGAPRCLIICAIGNDIARRLYLRAGFKVAGLAQSEKCMESLGSPGYEILLKEL